jgi:phosphoglucomutase
MDEISFVVKSSGTSEVIRVYIESTALDFTPSYSSKTIS